MTSSIQKSPTLLFLILTCALTAPFWALAIATGDSSGGRGAYAVGMMWGPGLAALLTCWLAKLPLRSLGWGWGKARWQLLSYLWPLAVCVVTYAIVYALGFGGFPNMDTVAEFRKSLHWPHAGTALVVGGWFVLFATTSLPGALSTALGEEIGWRGFLSPQLDARFGFTGGALLTGVIWAVWHFPILFFSDYDSATPLWFSTPCFVVEVLSLAIIMAWVRKRSGSLWTGAVAHASINMFNQGFFVPLTASRGQVTAYAIDESGAVLPIVLLVAAVLVWTQRDKPVRIESRAGDPDSGGT